MILLKKTIIILNKYFKARKAKFYWFKSYFVTAQNNNIMFFRLFNVYSYWNIDKWRHITEREVPRQSSSDGSAFAPWSKGHGFESRWILWDQTQRVICSMNLLQQIYPPIVVTPSRWTMQRVIKILIKSPFWVTDLFHEIHLTIITSS